MKKEIKKIRKSINIPQSCKEKYLDLQRPELQDWSDMHIFWFGASRLTPGYHICSPKSHALVLIATESGRGCGSFNGETRELLPGSLWCCPKGSPIEFRTSGDHWNIVWWYISDHPLWSGWSGPDDRMLQGVPSSFWFHTGSELIGALDQKSPRTASLQKCLLESLRQSYEKNIDALQPAGSDDLHLLNLWREVQNQLALPWTVELLSKKLNVSPATFQRRMQQQFGSSAHQMLLTQKMSQAKTLLAQTRYPLKIIADRLGFCDAYSFSQAFSRATGSPPKSYRKKIT